MAGAVYYISGKVRAVSTHLMGNNLTNSVRSVSQPHIGPNNNFLLEHSPKPDIDFV